MRYPQHTTHQPPISQAPTAANLLDAQHAAPQPARAAPTPPTHHQHAPPANSSAAIAPKKKRKQTPPPKGKLHKWYSEMGRRLGGIPSFVTREAARLYGLAIKLPADERADATNLAIALAALERAHVRLHESPSRPELCSATAGRVSADALGLASTLIERVDQPPPPASASAGVHIYVERLCDELRLKGAWARAAVAVGQQIEELGAGRDEPPLLLAAAACLLVIERHPPKERVTAESIASSTAITTDQLLDCYTLGVLPFLQELLSACQEAILPQSNSADALDLLAAPAPPTPTVQAKGLPRRPSRESVPSAADAASGGVPMDRVASEADATGPSADAVEPGSAHVTSETAESAACLHCGAPRSGPELCDDCRADQCQVCGKVDPIAIDENLRCFGCVREHLLRARMRIGALRPQRPFRVEPIVSAPEVMRAPSARAGAYFLSGHPPPPPQPPAAAAVAALPSTLPPSDPPGAAPPSSLPFAPSLPPALSMMLERSADALESSKGPALGADSQAEAAADSATAQRPARLLPTLDDSPSTAVLSPPAPSPTNNDGDLDAAALMPPPPAIPMSRISPRLGPNKCDLPPLMAADASLPTRVSPGLGPARASALPPSAFLDVDADAGADAGADALVSSEWERPMTDEELSALLASPMRPSTPSHTPHRYAGSGGRRSVEGLSGSSPASSDLSPVVGSSPWPSTAACLPPLSDEKASPADKARSASPSSPNFTALPLAGGEVPFSPLRSLSSPLRPYSPRQSFPIMALLQPPDDALASEAPSVGSGGSVGGAVAPSDIANFVARGGTAGGVLAPSDIANFVARGEQRALAEWAISTSRHASPYVGIPQSPLRIPQSPLHGGMAPLGGGSTRAARPNGRRGSADYGVAANVPIERQSSWGSQPDTSPKALETVSPRASDGYSLLLSSPRVAATAAAAGGALAASSLGDAVMGSMQPPSRRPIAARSSSLNGGGDAAPTAKRQRSDSGAVEQDMTQWLDTEEAFDLDPNQYGSNL